MQLNERPHGVLEGDLGEMGRHASRNNTYSFKILSTSKPLKIFSEAQYIMDNGLQLLLAAGAAILIILIIRRNRSTPESYAPLEEAPVTYAPAGQPAPRIIDPEETKGALLKASLGQPTSCSASANMLPKPSADGFAFAPNPSELTGQNFIDASRWVTLGAMSTKRNISRDIRSEIPIPKNNAVSPWNQSSIDQQVEGRPLDCPVDLK